ncbi:hypothetical protein N5853_00040 [Bartonella sp. HY329]|uniref:bpX5 domain-containing protein n=1 Tax=unclassified Bartonella TaxID=2645622 RepID=UPI0021C9B49C|nr:MULTISPECIES: hypothetical protein [unclassified Bartonella]UXM95093.1 hypothetical protein N5853_00040 [Bartonella sp. HY329]UXN09416.1 hypothetical protein N5852_00040 [Bartonella sp. HY328]
MAKFDWQWQARPNGLTAKGMIVFGPASFDLLERLKAIDDSVQQAALQIVGFRYGIVVLGPLQYLPWCENGHYIGHDLEAPELWLPLHSMPNAPLDLLLAAFKKRFPAPFLLWPEPRQLIDLRRQFPIQSSVLTLLRQELEENAK